MPTPPELPTENLVCLSASNRFYLALKTFGYSLLGYFIIAVILVVFVSSVEGSLSSPGRSSMARRLRV